MQQGESGLTSRSWLHVTTGILIPILSGAVVAADPWCHWKSRPVPAHAGSWRDHPHPTHEQLLLRAWIFLHETGEIGLEVLPVQ